MRGGGRRGGFPTASLAKLPRFTCEDTIQGGIHQDLQNTSKAPKRGGHVRCHPADVTSR